MELSEKELALSLALLEAVKKSTPKKVSQLLQAGAVIDFQDDLEATALHYAAQHNLKSIVTVLIDGGANLDMQNDLGDTPLILAAARGHHLVVKCLLKAGADVSLKNSGENTALHRVVTACLAGNLEPCKDIVTLLLEKGADKNDLNKAGHSPIALARQMGYSEIADLIEQWKPAELVSSSSFSQERRLDESRKRHRQKIEKYEREIEALWKQIRACNQEIGNRHKKIARARQKLKILEARAKTNSISNNQRSHHKNGDDGQRAR